MEWRFASRSIGRGNLENVVMEHDMDGGIDGIECLWNCTLEIPVLNSLNGRLELVTAVLMNSSALTMSTIASAVRSL